MKEINIATTIVRLRKEKNISQGTLANFLGVSKAAVSKWETELSYPDITLLPKLATYFNITIDQLLNYQPQLSKQEIKQIYEQLATSFLLQPYDEVLANCRELIKKYYSCNALLLQIAALYINYSNLIPEEELPIVFDEALSLFKKIRTESDQIDLVNQAQSLEAVALLILKKPEEVIQLLGETSSLLVSTDSVLASAFQMKNDFAQVEYILQVGIYQHLFVLLELLTSYLSFYAEHEQLFDETYQRILSIIETFHLKELSPTTLMNVYIVAAQEFVKRNQIEQALQALSMYTELVTSEIYPIELHGDAYFTRLDEWVSEISIPTPRDQQSIKNSMLEVLTNNPTFTTLMEQKQFQALIKKIKNTI